ncbi:MAG: glycosyltransferase [Rhodobacter sp.]|nr:glycosyltransferase [Rhodobacter sp.]
MPKDHETDRLATSADIDPVVASTIDCVVIGRNEGDRLVRCLASLQGKFRRIVYVDSGSTDGSLEAAESSGAETVALDATRPFAASRARNAGLKALACRPPEFVQLIDGDCVLRDGWVEEALGFMNETPAAAVVCGRRRELSLRTSVFNRLCDREWNTPVGRAKACGGDAVVRFDALKDIGGFREDLIAGEEPELCLRLRREGWEIWRIDAEMTWHDAAITRLPQWWSRTKRAGYAFAEGAAMYGRPPERHWKAETRRAVVWGLVLPSICVLASLASFAGLLLWLAYPLQVSRLAWREGIGRREAWEYAFFTVLGRVPEAIGVMSYHLRRLGARRSDLIEYK